MSFCGGGRFQPLRRVARKYGPRLFLVLLIINSTLEVIQVRYSHLTPRLEFSHPSPPSERIYIASLHWNNAPILDRYWNNAVVDLATALGPQNVFVSAYESGSFDNTKSALRRLDKQLEKIGVRRNFTLDKTTHKNEMEKDSSGPGWVTTPSGKKELRRIPFLARLRNQALEPLRELHRQGEKFDKLLFLNDVVFQANDALRLLTTNNGEYAAACSLDFNNPPEYYDTFALRDSEGHETVLQTWPYFRARESRSAIKNNLPVPVKSCWNGMVAMPIKPFVEEPPLQFRGIPDSLATYHLEGSECCLIHADNQLSMQKGVYLNPHVRVAYSQAAYEALHPKPHQDELTVWRIFTGLWKNRLARWFTTPMFKEWAVQRLVRTWEQQGDGNQERGTFCIINEMQVLVERGWKHV